MRATFGWVLLAGLSASPAPAQMPTAREREDYLAYVVAAAKAEGDLVSDAAMVGLLDFQLESADSPAVRPQDVSASEQALRAEATVLRAQLSARVQAALMDNAELLSRDRLCHDQGAPAEECARRRSRLAELAGDNAYYHLVLMARAWQSGDSAGFLAHARAGAAADRYRSPYMDYYAGLHARFRQVPDQVGPTLAPKEDGVPRAATMAMALSAAYALPPYQGFSAPCREAEGELREECLDIALLQLASAQTPIEVSLATGVIEALGDDPVRELAQAKRQEAFWRIEQVGELHRLAAQGKRPVGYDAYFDDYGTQGELEAARLLLVANGVAPAPPQGWQSAFYRKPASP
jgi:hypothetical protein